jgi:hypothetical protein
MTTERELAGDPWTDRLSGYLDGDLDARTRAGLEAHLPTCAECRGLLDDLRAVAARAAALEDRPPAADLWPGIARRLDEKSPGFTQRLMTWATGFRIALTLPQIAAAAALLVVVSGGAVWMLANRPATAPAPIAGDPVPTTDSVSPTNGGADAISASYDFSRYDATIADLETVLRTHRSVLDSSTVRIVEQNLITIDRAINEARRALEADPASSYLNHHLAAQLQRKVRLLQQAAAVVAVQQG